MAQLTILSMNCLGLPVPVPGLRTRLRALGNAIAHAGVAVACLQEVGRWRHIPLLRHSESAWPEAIAATYPYAPKGGLVTLSRLPILDTNYNAFRERGRAASLHAAERFQGKGVLQASLRLLGRKVVILNTHLAANYSAQWSYGNAYARVERAQLREVAEIVQAMPAEALVIVAGDLNVPRGSWLYTEFLRLARLSDPLAGSTEPTFRPMAGVPARAIQALDHILVRAPHDLSITAHAELCFREAVPLAGGARGYLSDHLGVRLTLSWQNTPHPSASEPVIPEPATTLASPEE